MLYQKVRPQTLGEMMGDTALFSSIEAAFERPIHNHAILLAGDPGCGKTTVARAIASKLGAHPTSIRELNTGDDRGIDAIRSLIATMKTYPIIGKVSVYIIDEAHGLTPDAIRAFLKPLEDCPSHVYVFFCTPEPEALFKGKDGKALESRLAKWYLNKLSEDDIYKLLVKVSLQENLGTSEKELRAMAAQADGVPREALTLLEQSYSGAMAPQTSVSANLTFEFCGLLKKSWANAKSWPTVGAKLKAMKEAGINAESVRRVVQGYAASFLYKGDDMAAFDMIDIFDKTTYDSGFNEIVRCAYMVVHATP